MIKNNPYSNWPFPLYFYFIRTYFRFFTMGKCLTYPRAIQIQTQSMCNGQCFICPYRVTSRIVSHGVMEWSLFKKIVDELVTAAHLPLLMFSLHNEPLLDERIFDWIGYLKSKLPQCYCILATNGELLDRFSLAQIINSSLDQINISLNAYTKETYKQMNPAFDHEKIIQKIGHLLLSPIIKQKIQIMFVHNEKNSPEIQPAIDYWKQKGIISKVVEITNRAGSLDTYEKLRVKDKKYKRELPLRILKKLMSQMRSIIGCELPFYQMNILFNGDVIICSYDWKRATIVGNLMTHSLKEIWNSEKINDIRKNLLQKKYDKVSACGVCSVVNINAKLK